MDEKVVMDFISTIGEKIGNIDSKYDKLTSYYEVLEKEIRRVNEISLSIDKKLDETWDRVTEIKKDVDYINKDIIDIKSKIKLELDTIWNEIRRFKNEVTSIIDKDIESCRDNCDNELKNYAKVSYVNDKISNVKFWIMSSSIVLLVAMLAYFLVKVFNKVTIASITLP